MSCFACGYRICGQGNLAVISSIASNHLMSSASVHIRIDGIVDGSHSSNGSLSLTFHLCVTLSAKAGVNFVGDLLPSHL